MTRVFLIGAGLALALGVSAQAQDMPQQAPDPAANPPTSAKASLPGLKAGTPIKDSSGSLIGTIVKVGQTAAGEQVAEVSIDGKSVKLPVTVLTPAPDGGSAISSLSKSAILSASGKPRK